MTETKILAGKKVKELLSQINAQWGACLKEWSKGYFFIVSNKEKVYLAGRGCGEIGFAGLRINSIGLYFAEIKNGIRLSIEGSQIIGPMAAKNVVELTDDDAKNWLSGEDIPKTGEFSGFVILKHRSDFLGTGKYKEGVILNFVPKTRRLPKSR